MGKTTLAVDIICAQLFKSVRRCFAACPTFWQQPALAPLRRVKLAFPPKHVFTNVDDNLFDRLFHLFSRDRVPTLLFVDDAAAEQATNKGNKGAFARLCLAAPHINLTIVGVFQRLASCSPALRDNCECLISFKPTQLPDVDRIIQEYNPCPAEKLSKDIVRRALSYAWDNARFCFIWREKFTGRMLYYVGLQEEIHFK